MKAIRYILSLMAAGLMGLAAYAQTAADFYKDNPTRLYGSKVRITIGHSDYYHVGNIPEHQVRLDYYLCKAITHEVESMETRTISFRAGDFSNKLLNLSAPAGYQIRDDIHYELLLKVGGEFKSCQTGLRDSYKYNDEGVLFRDTNLYVTKDQKEIGVMTGEFNLFYDDKLTGLEYNRKNNPKLNKPYFTTDSRGYAMPGPLNELKLHVRTTTKNANDKRHSQMKPNFWPNKVAKEQLKHTMMFRLAYDMGNTKVPEGMKLYLTMEAPLYNRNGNLSYLDNYDSGDGINLSLSSSSRKPWVQGQFVMNDDERLFVYPFWMVVAEDLTTGEFTTVGVGLADLTNLSSEVVHVINVTGSLKAGNLKITEYNKD